MSQRVVVVLGMGRTGTSMCCQALEHMGVAFGDNLFGPHPRNQKGHYEDLDIVRLNMRALNLWSSKAGWMFSGSLPPRWWEDARLDSIADEMSATLMAKMDRWGLFGFKDQRTTRLLPLWKRVFMSSELDPIYFLCLRGPDEVFESIRLGGEVRLLPEPEARRGIYAIWSEYYHDGMRVNPCRIWYEDWERDETINLAKLAESLNVPVPGGSPFEIELRHARV